MREERRAVRRDCASREVRRHPQRGQQRPAAVRGAQRPVEDDALSFTLTFSGAAALEAVEVRVEARLTPPLQPAPRGRDGAVRPHRRGQSAAGRAKHVDCPCRGSERLEALEDDWPPRARKGLGKPRVAELAAVQPRDGLDEKAAGRRRGRARPAGKIAAATADFAAAATATFAN